MGPTWTKLVDVGIEKYPQATHGIIADADFTPINGFDKRQLDRKCQKHMFTITTDATAGTARRMDWIYRNLKGAKVERRTHQTLIAPTLDPKQWGGRCPSKVQYNACATHMHTRPVESGSLLTALVLGWQDANDNWMNQTLIDFVIQEHTGGYQDRTPGMKTTLP